MRIAGPISVAYDENGQPVFSGADSIYDLSGGAFSDYSGNKFAGQRLKDVTAANRGYMMGRIPEMVYYDESSGKDPTWRIRDTYEQDAERLFNLYRGSSGSGMRGSEVLSPAVGGKQLMGIYNDLRSSGVKPMGGLTQAGLQAAMDDPRFGVNRAQNYLLANKFRGFKGQFGRQDDPNAETFQQYIDRTGQRGALDRYMKHVNSQQLGDFSKFYAENYGDAAGMGDHQGPQNTSDLPVGLDNPVGAAMAMFGGYTDPTTGQFMGGAKSIPPTGPTLGIPQLFSGALAAVTGHDKDLWGWGGGWTDGKGGSGYDASQEFGAGYEQHGPHSADGGPGMGYGE